jgi:DNA repair exonuclease SbcCD ATPase subunit
VVDATQGDEGQRLPDEPQKAAGEDSFAKKLASLAKREEALLRSQRAAKQEYERARAALEERDRRIQELEQRASKAQELQRALDEVKGGSNAIAALQNLGIDFEQLVDAVATAGTPDAAVRAMRTDLQRQLDEMREWQASQEKAAKDREEMAKAAEMRALADRARQEAVQHVYANWEKFPNLSELSEKRIQREIFEKAAEYKEEYGEFPTSLDECLQMVEDDLAAEESSRQDRRSKRTPAANRAPATQPASTQGQASQRDGATGDSEGTGDSGDDLAAKAREWRQSAFAGKRPSTLSNRDEGKTTFVRRSVRGESREELLARVKAGLAKF